MGSKHRLAVAVLAAALTTSTTHAGPLALRTAWVPANTGVLWWQGNDPDYPLSGPRQPPGDPTGAWWLTRRIAASPHVPTVMHLGSFFHGIYVSAGGGAWATLTPGCWLPVDPPSALSGIAPTYHALRRGLIAITGLDACGVEGIVYDPVLPNRIYASAYDVVALKGYAATLGDGGVYVSDNLGVSWRKLLGGIRGNGLAVHRRGSGPATIVTGYIQVGAVVGSTPNGNTASLSISRDEGFTWDHVTLPSAGCADTPLTSQRIAPTVAISPTDADRIFVGTNAGLYDSSDGATSWVLRRGLCGGIWGIAVTRDGSTIYVGDKDAQISTASTATMSFSPVVDLGSGRIQQLVLDPRDPTGRTLFASVWDGSSARVFRVAGSAVTPLDDSLFRDVIPLDQAWPSSLPKPFPLAYKMPDGTAPSLFLAQQPALPGALYVSTIFRGVFLRFT